MTRHKHAHTGLVTPQLPQQWLTAALRLFAMLVHNVASTFRMKQRRRLVNATPTMPLDLPERTNDTQAKETIAVQHDSPKALSLRDRLHAVRTMELHRAIVSKDEGVLTACHPGNAQRYPEPTHPVGQTAQWIPALHYAPAGMTTIGAFENAQPARSLNSASPHLRSSRRKSGSRAPWVMLAGLRTQPWIPAFAGMSGSRSAKDAPLN